MQPQETWLHALSEHAFELSMSLPEPETKHVRPLELDTRDSESP